MSTQFSGVHSVEIYDADRDLIKSVSAIVMTSLSLGDSVLVVATPEHRDQFAQELVSYGFDLDRCTRDGRYITQDAEAVMKAVMRDGHPDRIVFDDIFGKAISGARVRARNQNRGLTIYGECVALLWEDGRKEAALELERFWEELFQDDPPIHLHCAYPRSVFAEPLEIDSVQKLHSHVLQ
jgi:hypothetical protein